MTFMNKSDPADPVERPWPVWATLTGIFLLASVLAIALLYREGGSLFALDDASIRALVFLLLMTISAIAWWLRRRPARS